MVGPRVVLTAALMWWADPAPGCLIEHTRFLPGVFSSERTALSEVAAEVGADSIASDVEYVGALYRADVGLRVNVGRGCPGEDGFTIRLPVPEGHTLIAFWHTHGAPGAHRALFSPEDFALVAAQRRPFYLITPAGELRVLRPGMTIRQGAGLGSLALRPADLAHSVPVAQSAARPTNR